MTQRAQRKLEATAHHEAGHAVIAWIEGLRFKKVTIVPKGDVLGFVSTNGLPKWCNPDSDSYNEIRARLWHERDVKMSFAGYLAEAKYLKRKPRFGFHRDFQCTVDQAFSICGSQRASEAWLKWLWIKTEQIVELHWKAIHDVADALLTQGTLTEKEALHVARTAFGPI